MRHLILVIDNEFEIPGVLREGLTPIGFDVVWVNVVAILGNEWLKKTQFEGHGRDRLGARTGQGVVEGHQVTARHRVGAVVGDRDRPGHGVTGRWGGVVDGLHDLQVWVRSE